MVSMLVSGCVSLVASQNNSVPGKLRDRLPKYPEVGDANQLTLWPSQWAIPGVQAPKSLVLNEKTDPEIGDPPAQLLEPNGQTL